jgi:hypothetical protein
MQSQFQAKQQGTWPRFILTGNYLVVGGGGSGGQKEGGGGGAGGYRASGFGPSPLQGSNIELAPGPYAITVGGGGAARSGSNPIADRVGRQGTSSIFNVCGVEGTNKITSNGGGGGNSEDSGLSAPAPSLITGASGGGAS